MAKGIKVKINQAAWGNQVMAGPEMQQYLANLGSQVAGKLPGGSVEVTTSRTVKGGGRRARAVVTTTIPLEDEAANGTALAALQSVVPSAHAPKRTRAYKVREKKRQERRA
ncbi:hypothetical protein IT072_02385 [Leifsonia sp. ZF2019]|uniref:hypothetical protein n=1 Tax=Leifsonia sp. ZF2019 TaxID=2781978 RepID=UPI001CC182E8|nr:hypothetical protein [Leifsonia sp. ZF2019]UAJ78315.1 hypothetical protein IT072_13710 [Leifsonia sp. ZF2019]UAJ79945.1 hypothetical protein IT072_02385 [Leifsonia sp. ZF2019]